MYIIGIRCGKKILHDPKKMLYTIGVSETKPIPVRLDDALIARLDRIADRIGTTRSSVIRMLVSTWVESFERAGTASLPMNWESLMADLDGRTSSKFTLVAEDPTPYETKKKKPKP